MSPTFAPISNSFIKKDNRDPPKKVLENIMELLQNLAEPFF